MKNYLLALSVLLCIIGAGCTAGYVTTRPADVTYVRPASPGPDYVWIDGEWYGNHGHYNYKQGYWAHNRPGHNWNRGRWENRSGGYVWIKGGWN